VETPDSPSKIPTPPESSSQILQFTSPNKRKGLTSLAPGQSPSFKLDKRELPKQEGKELSKSINPDFQTRPEGTVDTFEKEDQIWNNYSWEQQEAFGQQFEQDTQNDNFVRQSLPNFNPGIDFNRGPAEEATMLNKSFNNRNEGARNFLSSATQDFGDNLALNRTQNSNTFEPQEGDLSSKTFRTQPK